jgi:hypothetical protein
MWQSKKRMLRDWEPEIALTGVMSDRSRRAYCAGGGTCWFRSERLLRREQPRSERLLRF